MDEDTADLIMRLCARAGMVMEDASVLALTIGRNPSAQLGVLEGLETAIRQMSDLVRAARSLAEEPVRQTRGKN